MKSRAKNVAEAKRQARADKLLGPGFFVLPPKTTLSVTAYREAEVFSIEQALEYIHAWSQKQDDLQIAIQGKYDGASCFLHRTAEGEFFVFTEDGSDVTERMPRLVEKAKEKFPNTSYIILGEVEKWITQGAKRIHQGREYVSGEIHTTTSTPPKDRTYVWNIYDLIWFDGKDLHNLTYQQRYETLQKEFHFEQSLLSNMQPGFNLAPTNVCRTDEAIRKTLERLVKLEFLEGAMIKKWNGFKFELDGRTSDELKFKKYAEAHLWAVDKRTISGADKTFQYKVAVEVLPSEMDELDEKNVIDFKGKKAMIVAKSFNTNVQANVGDILTVQFHNVYATRNESGKLKLTLYEPKVYENRTLRGEKDEPDTITTLMKIARDSQLLRFKGMTDDEHVPFELFKQVGIFAQYPAEGRRYPFIIHNHWRGKSVHADLRLAHVNRQYLIGYTLDVQIPGVVKEPVLTMEAAKQQIHNKELWKFNVATGEFMSRQTRGGLKKATSCVVQLKAPEPIEWLSFEGVVESGGVGSTKEYPGVFVIAARGEVEYGFRNGYFHEYWFHCREWEGGGQRLVFRQLTSDFSTSLPLDKLLQWAFDKDKPIKKFQVYDERLIVCNAGELTLPEALRVDFNNSVTLALAPAEKPEIRTPTMWMLIKPNDAVPYVLSRRAVAKGRMTPYGVSALPRMVKEHIPAEFAYWTIKDAKQAQEVRDQLVEAIKKKKVQISLDIYKEAIPTEKEEEIQTAVEVEREFVLNRRTWRGPIVIRVGYSAELFDLWLSSGDGAMLFTFNDDPRSATDAVGTLEKFPDKVLMNATGELLAGSRLNPNKKLPVKVSRLVKGKLLLYVDEPQLKKFQVKSRGWKGLYLLEQDGDSNVWTIKSTSNVGEPLDSKPTDTGGE